MTRAEPEDPLAELGQWSLYFRLVIVMFASLAMAFVEEPNPLLPLVVVLAALLNLVLVLRWERIAPFLARHPLLLLPDLVLSTGLLLLTGIDGPLLFYCLGTVFLGGLVYGQVGGVTYAVLVVLGYLLASELRVPLADRAYGFQELVMLPVLLVVLAFGAGAIRELLLRRFEAERRALTEREGAAISADRARLARELHDSVAKTLQGIALQAAGLEGHVRRDPERAVAEARAIGRTSARAARESRELLTALRSQRLDVPLDRATEQLATGWSQRTGIELDLVVEPIGEEVDPAVRHELLSIAGEALRNVERHAQASRVWLRLHAEAGELRLHVSDDGVGLPTAPDTEHLAAIGHYGLRGIVERAERVGGRAHITAAPDEGLTIEVRAKVADVQPDLGGRQTTGGVR